MTDTANAPERIKAWMQPYFSEIGSWSTTRYPEVTIEYVLATHCDELVAAAYLDATQVLEDEIDLARIALPQAVPVLRADIRAIKNRTPTKAKVALTARDERMKAEGAREAQAELIEEPTEPGSFVGDIWFGRQDNRTYGTHRWDGAAWQALPTETEALIGLLAKERAKIARLTEALKEIAHQKKTSELDTEYDVECADFEAGYDACIDRARAALQENANG